MSPDTTSSKTTDLVEGTLSLSSSPRTEGVINITKVGETRVSRTVYEYAFTVGVQNGSKRQLAVTAALVSAGSGAEIIEDSVLIGDMGANAVVQSAAAIVIRQDRTSSFDLSALVWKVAGQPDNNLSATSVGPEGGVIAPPSGNISLGIPLDAVSKPLTITTSSAELKLRGVSFQGLAFEMGPAGTTFSKPLTITVKYDASKIPAGMQESALQMAYLDGGSPVFLQTTVDVVAKTLTAEISHFSNIGVPLPPEYFSAAAAFKVGNIDMPDTMWHFHNGCWGFLETGIIEAQKQYIDRVGDLSAQLFKTSRDKPFLKWDGEGCITTKYLEKKYTYWTTDKSSGEDPVRNESHAGVDFRTRTKSENGSVKDATAYAVAKGSVVRGGSVRGPAGCEGSKCTVPPGIYHDKDGDHSALIIESGPYWIFYLHCSSHFSLEPGVAVNKGDAVCKTGNVGAGKDNHHLHFEVRLKAADSNPSALAGSHCLEEISSAWQHTTDPSADPFSRKRARACSTAKLRALSVDPTIILTLPPEPPPPPPLNYPTSCKGQSTVMDGWTRFGTATFDEDTNTYSVGDTISYDPNDSDNDCNPPGSWGGNKQDNDWTVYNRSTIGDIEFSAQACITPSPLSGHLIGLSVVDPLFTGVPGSGHGPFLDHVASFTTQWNRPGVLQYIVGSSGRGVEVPGATLSSKGFCGTYRMTRVGNLYSVYFNGNLLASAVGSTAAIVPIVMAYDNVVTLTPTVTFGSP